MLLWTKTSTGLVYNVTPDDHYYPNTTCHHCHNVHHYLLNTTKYFTSNTQLLFLPGLNHLHTDLIIQNVHNISLIGSTTDGTTPDTIIQCNSSVGIVMTNITNLIVTNITVRSCLGNEYNNAAVLMKQCTNVQLRHVVIEESHNSYGIVSINILGDSHFSFISNHRMEIIYNDTTVNKENHSLTIDHYHNSKSENSGVEFKFQQSTYRVKFTLINCIFQMTHSWQLIYINFDNQGIGQSMVSIKSCQFTNNQIHGSLILIGVELFNVIHSNIVEIVHCTFYNNTPSTPACCTWKFIIILDGPDVNVKDCIFYNSSKNGQVLRRVSKGDCLIELKTSSLYVTNTSFLWISGTMQECVISIEAGDLYLIGPIIFGNIAGNDSVIKLRKSANVTLSGYVEFSNISEKAIISHDTSEYFMMFVNENATINVSQNSFKYFAVYEFLTYKYSYCYFQYLSGESLDVKWNYRNYSIVFQTNIEKLMNSTYNNLPITHCKWLPQSVFNTEIPLEVNKRYIKYISKAGTSDLLPQNNRKKNLCYCDKSIRYDCYKDILDPVYPGQTMTLPIYEDNDIAQGFKYSDTVISVANDIDWLPPTTCVITNSSELVQIAKSYTCNTLEYTISSHNEKWCELFLKVSSNGDENIDIYYIKLKPCPEGFVKLDGTCQCYPFLKKLGINCEINEQTLIRPANVWILPVLHSNSYVYIFSQHCPFHYCLPHSSHLNISTPNSQCQFNRSGILCGHCQQGLSTAFGSSHCQQCSNTYIFLIVPIAIAGLVLVLLLFILNLTVTDGTINAFILYANIISINTPVFFLQTSKFAPAYTFVSLANLDLGIQTCFYNGMDDYAKMWLQLAFPFYLIFIAISLIITSRYSTTIQRLTARRALPVLATLFLLSYTKILLVVSRALFSYSKVTYLPSGHTTIVWSVDANLPLNGGKVIVLLLACSILFLTLIPFNIILLFTRTLSRFKFITKFKPLLDAYQGPYKIKYYYWTGLQLVIRTAFFGISSLDRNVNLAIGMMLLSILGGIHGIMHPFKNDIKTYQELVLILNLQAIYTSSLYGEEATTKIILNIMIAMAAVHLALIVFYHIITYLCGDVIKSKIKLKFNRLAGKIRSLCNYPPVQEYKLEGTTCDKIPEVTYCYNEYQEPLVGYSH